MQGARGTRLAASAVTIQAAYRGMAVRKEMRRIRAAASRIQVHFLDMPWIHLKVLQLKSARMLFNTHQLPEAQAAILSVLSCSPYRLL